MLIDIEKLKELYIEQNLSANKCAEYFGVSHPTIRKVLRDNNIPVRGICQKVDCPDITKFKELCSNEELTNDNIAEFFEVNTSQVVLWIKRYNIDRTWKHSVPSKEELIEDYVNKGMSFVDIGKKYGASNVTAKKWIVGHGIEVRSQAQSISLVLNKITTTKLERFGYKHFPYGPDALTFTRHSKGEIEIQEFLNSYGFEFKNDRTVLDGLELDLYDPKVNMAIEYCGERFHCENPDINNRGKYYHYEKYNKCRNKNIKLITIYHASEWLKRKKQIKEFLKTSLGIFDNRIYARNCIVKKLEIINRKFLEDNHIQGSKNDIICMYGLYYNDELLGVVAYSLDVKNSNIILSRLCFKDGYQVIGGASKLIKNSIKLENYDQVITWSDNRWSDGLMYEKIGFKLDSERPPEYSYTNGEKVVSKRAMNRSAKNYPKTITEKDYCTSIGWYRIWDCGKKRWIWKT